VGMMEAIRPMHTEVMVTEEGLDMDLPLDTLTEEAMTPKHPDMVDSHTEQEAMTLKHPDMVDRHTEEVDTDLPLDTLTKEAMTPKHTEVMLLTQQEAMTPKHPDMVDSHTQQEAMTPRHPDMVDSHTEEMDTELPLDTLTEEAMVRLTEQAVMGHLTLKRSNSSHHSTSMFSIVVPVGTNQHCLPH